MRVRHTFNVDVGPKLKARFRRYASRHLVYAARLIRRILGMVPWTDDRRVHIVLSIDKRLLRQPERLRTVLSEAAGLIVDRLAG